LLVHTPTTFETAVNLKTGVHVALLAELLNLPTADRYRPLDPSPQKRKERTLAERCKSVEFGVEAAAELSGGRCRGGVERANLLSEEPSRAPMLHGITGEAQTRV
jgi:hypothetical protein